MILGQRGDGAHRRKQGVGEANHAVRGFEGSSLRDIADVIWCRHSDASGVPKRRYRRLVFASHQSLDCPHSNRRRRCYSSSGWYTHEYGYSAPCPNAPRCRILHWSSGRSDPRDPTRPELGNPILDDKCTHAILCLPDSGTHFCGDGLAGSIPRRQRQDLNASFTRFWASFFSPLIENHV